VFQKNLTSVGRREELIEFGNTKKTDENREKTQRINKNQKVWEGMRKLFRRKKGGGGATQYCEHFTAGEALEMGKKTEKGKRN